MISPQTKSPEVIQELYASVMAGENLIGDFALHRLLKNVEAIPVLEERLSLKGLISILKGHVHEGMNLCERAINIAPYEAAFWVNYCCILNSTGHFSKLREIVFLALENINKCHTLLDTIATHASFSADLSLLNQATSLASKFSISWQNIFEKSAMEIFSLLKQNENNAFRLSSLVQELLSVAESNGIKNIVSSIKVDSDGILGYYCILNTTDIDLICSLNDELFDRIFEKNIDTTDCFAIFEGKGEI